MNIGYLDNELTRVAQFAQKAFYSVRNGWIAYEKIGFAGEDGRLRSNTLKSDSNEAFVLFFSATMLAPTRMDYQTSGFSRRFFYSCKTCKFYHYFENNHNHLWCIV